MARYRRRSFVNATQWFKLGDHPDVIMHPCYRHHGMISLGPYDVPVESGDWIINEHERVHIMHDVNFRETYELIDEQKDVK